MSTGIELLKSKGYTPLSIFSDEECQLTVNRNGLSFTTKTVQNMKSPEFVVLGINQEEKKISIAVTEKGPGAIPFVKDGKSSGVRIGIPGIKKVFRELMPEWNLDTYYYKVDGSFDNDHTFAEFDLSDFKEFERRGIHKKEEEDSAEPEPTPEAPEA